MEDFNLFLPSISLTYSVEDIKRILAPIGEIHAVFGKPLEFKDTFQCVRVYVKKWKDTPYTKKMKEAILGRAQKFHFIIDDENSEYWVITKHHNKPTVPKMSAFPALRSTTTTTTTPASVVAPTHTPATPEPAPPTPEVEEDPTPLVGQLQMQILDLQRKMGHLENSLHWYRVELEYANNLLSWNNNT